MRKQLNLIKPFIGTRSLESVRKWQDKLGELMTAVNRKNVTVEKQNFENFNGAWVIPKDERRHGVIMYLHGGGYTCGSIEYAKGFATVLATVTGMRVLCVAYRLAPENKFPAALDDAAEAYDYLCRKGYNKIVLAGESAGGGLCYSLSLLLKERQLLMPSGIIAVSPWTDLTLSGQSYLDNKAVDPTLTKEVLEFFAESYATERTKPLISPLFGELSNMPPSVIFAGGDEILLSDAVEINKKLCENGNKSTLHVAPGLWHAYLLYGLSESKRDFENINKFLTEIGIKESKLKWLALDNAAKIYPAARSQNWSNVFRVSCTLTEDVDIAVLKNALDVTVRRFPSIAARLRKGVFWYYIQQLAAPPDIKEENCYPLARMSREETRKSAIRVIAYKKRIAVEIFHSLTDGNGAMVFLKSLTAEYIEEKYNIRIPDECGILNRLEEPDEGEFSDDFVKNAAKVKVGRGGKTAFRLTGTDETAGFLNVTCLKIPVKRVLEEAHKYGVSLTVFLCGVMMEALIRIQRDQVSNVKRRKPIKVLIPVNLRKLFTSNTLRNFVFYIIPEIEPQLGQYSFKEILSVVDHTMGLEITPKQMSKKIAANVESEQKMILRITPLFIKNIVMKAIFNAVGEKKSCLTLSNLGQITVPDEMLKYVERMDFVLGIQAAAPYNCGVLSFKDTLYINFIRNIKEPLLEAKFFEVLREMNVPVTVESNQRGE